MPENVERPDPVRIVVVGRFMVTGQGLSITGYFIDENLVREPRDARVVAPGDEFIEQSTGATVTIRSIPFLCRPGSPPDDSPERPLSLTLNEQIPDSVQPGSLLVARRQGDR